MTTLVKWPFCTGLADSRFYGCRVAVRILRWYETKKNGIHHSGPGEILRLTAALLNTMEATVPRDINTTPQDLLQNRRKFV
jgi:hypothetical protein